MAAIPAAAPDDVLIAEQRNPRAFEVRPAWLFG
jgi:hypothetical protein